MRLVIRCSVFFFQAEDGIRDWSVTGVQTCALPIYRQRSRMAGSDPAPGQEGARDPPERGDQQGDRRRRADPGAPGRRRALRRRRSHRRRCLHRTADAPRRRTAEGDGVHRRRFGGIPSRGLAGSGSGGSGSRGVRHRAGGPGGPVTFCDLLRMTVLLSAGAATVLAAVTVIAVSGGDDTLTIYVAAVWWTAALVGGLLLGRPSRAAEEMTPVLADARMATALPEIGNPTRAALARLWPIGAFAVIAGVLGLVFPGVAAVGAGFALAVALAWRAREGAVAAIEERD